jgi:hypothetical protein
MTTERNSNAAPKIQEYVRAKSEAARAARRRSDGERGPRSKLLRDRILRLRAERRELKTSFELERSQRFVLTGRCSGLEAQYRRLMHFYAAAQKLLASESREDLFAAIQEVVTNLIGCEEIGIFRINEEKCNLSCVSSLGLDQAGLEYIPIGCSLIGATMLNREPYFGGATKYRLPQEANITACVPLHWNNRLLGAIGIFRLLPQKPVLTAEDKELLHLVGKMASTLLLCTAVDGCRAPGKRKPPMSADDVLLSR